MQGKIGLEEHFAIPETIMDSAGFLAEASWEVLRRRLLDIHDERLREMDACGMELMILSLNAPAVQAIADTAKAVELARRANDFLAEQVVRRPDRFQAFAALPMQDAEAAATELGRCMRDLGFRGALVNGFSQVTRGSGVAYYDHADYLPFWAEAEALERVIGRRAAGAAELDPGRDRLAAMGAGERFDQARRGGGRHRRISG